MEGVVAPVPILITAFNRPDRLRRLIDSLAPISPSIVRISIDGPRGERDIEGVTETRTVARSIPWECDVQVLDREENVGIARAIPEAVTWVLTEFERVFVIEDDVTLGPQAYEFVARGLDLWYADPRIYSISAYNMVPPEHLTSPDAPARLSRVMSSYAWGTWRDRWEVFDPEMSWFQKQSVASLTHLLGSRIAALRWRQHHRMVTSGLVDSWAYRWVMSTWARGGFSVVPNRSLVRYHGVVEGSHTRRRRPWRELPVAPVDFMNFGSGVTQCLDRRADMFQHRWNQRASIANVFLGPLERLALRFSNRGRTVGARS